MSDKMRWRYGDTNPVVAAPAPSVDIEIGDIVYQVEDEALPVKQLIDSTVDPASADFLGVAMQRSRKGETMPIRVATTGVFEFDIVDTTRPHVLGQLISIVAGENQKVNFSSPKYGGIGRIAKRNPSGAQTVLVDIRSVVMTGGIPSLLKP